MGLSRRAKIRDTALENHRGRTAVFSVCLLVRLAIPAAIRAAGHEPRAERERPQRGHDRPLTRAAGAIRPQSTDSSSAAASESLF